MKKNLLKDAVNLSTNILGSFLPNHKWGIVNIAQDPRDRFLLKNYPSIPTVFGYTFDNTFKLLEEHSVIEGKTIGWWVIGISKVKSYWDSIRPPEISLDDNIVDVAHSKGYIKNNEIIKYYYQANKMDIGPRYHGQMAILVNKKSLLNFIQRFSNNRINNFINNDFYYENGELRLLLKDGTYSTLDLSKANKYRPIFESFYYLFRDTGKTLFTKKELLIKYKELTKNDIEWKDFIKKKSSICGKMINSKQILKDRIVWEYIKKNDQYKFNILTLSDN
ncbi:MAG TPA: hypothetical protein PLS49_03140 [Candidatus Woesebacteria bacterium]|nr:hypothetical protein [Candidatus Woesebacteria bacterium]